METALSKHVCFSFPSQDKELWQRGRALILLDTTSRRLSSYSRPSTISAGMFLELGMLTAKIPAISGRRTLTVAVPSCCTGTRAGCSAAAKAPSSQWEQQLCLTLLEEGAQKHTEEATAEIPRQHGLYRRSPRQTDSIYKTGLFSTRSRTPRTHSAIRSERSNAREAALPLSLTPRSPGPAERLRPARRPGQRSGPRPSPEPRSRPPVT